MTSDGADPRKALSTRLNDVGYMAVALSLRRGEKRFLEVADHTAGSSMSSRIARTTFIAAHP